MSRLRDRFGVSERRACRVVGQHRSTQRLDPPPISDEERQLREFLRAFSTARPRWGWRRAAKAARKAGWEVNDKRIRRLWRDWGPPGYDTDAELEAALAALPSLAHRQAAVGYYRALVRPRRPLVRYAELHSHRFALPRVPILHMHGEEDGAMLAEYSQPITSVLPQGSRVQFVPAAGHFLHIERPDVVATAILDFVRPR